MEKCMLVEVGILAGNDNDGVAGDGAEGQRPRII
jgi:hypothetical protein